MSKITEGVRSALLRTVLANEDPKLLTDSTPLLTGGLLDSVRTVTLIGELERVFGVSFEAHEMSVDYLDSVELIAHTIAGKLG
ncbi:MAG: acyl carrier protein [Planctomycetaceae bacterium]|nr:acyl carrier protein [Planctomycetaceae bacterium]